MNAAQVDALLARIGPIWGDDIRTHRDQVLDAYAPLLDATAAAPGPACTRGLSYGPDPRHVLDIYRSPESNGPLPVVVFMHGGAYVRGDKDIAPRVYANVPTWFARQGYLGVNLEYRLAPGAPYPGGADDLGRALAWLRANVGAYGGDPGRMFAIGHSAGGTHVAHHVLDPQLPYRGEGLRAAAILSGRLRADALPANPNAAGVRAYFGNDQSRYEALSPVSMAAPDAIPLFVAIAEYENPLLDVYGAEFFHRLRACGHRANQFLMLPRHNHMSIMAHFDTGEDFLGHQLCSFFARYGAVRQTMRHAQWRPH
ncbi:alpha/beta hydrolase [Pigmentiphaga kullae]|uniref:Acetyl esterase/lipase n=1 Tax=Pigmentiphaga kullae TaxID=151784 RepID=A0A4Q7NMP5_9BURK|nr:alpha/beta hydrolase [Pigmentiphaga kullae]RZS86474.1 acetyl esterase/lipase [Pigmentiphaga kullae]